MVLTGYRLVARQIGAAVEREEPEDLWFRPVLGIKLCRCHCMLPLLLLLVLIASDHNSYLIAAAHAVCLFNLLQPI